METRIRLYPHFPKPDGTSLTWWRTPEGQIVELETHARIPEPVKPEDDE
jgi:hypothetical protein